MSIYKQIWKDVVKCHLINTLKSILVQHTKNIWNDYKIIITKPEIKYQNKILMK